MRAVPMKNAAGVKVIQSAVEQLCPNCALCCNGVIFADVTLQAGDDARRLRDLGVPLIERRWKIKFPQPCACLEGCRCRIYAERPIRCRTFECRLLQRVQRGETSIAGALKTIDRARRQVAAIQRLLHQLGQRDEQLPLSKRYRLIMRQPIDLAAGEKVPQLRGKLMLAAGKLAEILGTHFLG